MKPKSIWPALVLILLIARYGIVGCGEPRTSQIQQQESESNDGVFSTAIDDFADASDDIFVAPGMSGHRRTVFITNRTRNDRGNFTNTVGQHLIWGIRNYELVDTEFNIRDTGVVPEGAVDIGLRYLARHHQGRALVYVHGFNVTFDRVLLSATKVSSTVDFRGSVFAFSWPSMGLIHRYGTDEEHAAQSVQPLQQALSRLEAAGFKHVTIIANSMGSRVLFGALTGMASKLKYRTDLLFTHADLDQQIFRAGARKLVANADHIVSISNESDNALRASESRHQALRLGQGGSKQMVVPGVTFIDFSGLHLVNDLLGHSVGFRQHGIMEIGDYLKTGQLIISPRWHRRQLDGEIYYVLDRANLTIRQLQDSGLSKNEIDDLLPGSGDQPLFKSPDQLANSARSRWTMVSRSTDEEHKSSVGMTVDLRKTYRDRQLGAWKEKVFTVSIKDAAGAAIQDTIVLAPVGWDGDDYRYEGSGKYNYTLWVGDFGRGPECQLFAKGRIIGWTEMRFWAGDCRH